MTKDIRELDNFCKNLQLFMQETIFDGQKSFCKFPLNLFFENHVKIVEKHKDKLGPNFDLASYEAMIRQSLKAGFHFIVCSDAPSTEELYYESF